MQKLAKPDPLQSANFLAPLMQPLHELLLS